MNTKKATRHRCSGYRANRGSVQSQPILPNFDRATLVAGLLVAISFGCMFVYGAVMF